MRAKEFVIEAFDQPYKLTWEQGEYGSYDAYTQLPDGSGLSINFNLESGGPEGMDEEWHVEFWRNQSLAVTGQGDAQRIFATVLAAIQDFAAQENPETIVFSASKEVEPGQNPNSRVNLYKRLVQRYAQSMGYKVQSQDQGKDVLFRLERASLDEGWKDWVAGAATAGALALGSPQAQAATPTVAHTPITQQQLQQTADVMANPLAQVLKKVAISSGIVGSELAQFMAQCAHETANFTSMKEFGGTRDFKKYDPKHAPKKAKALGNVKPGDGARYHGRGFIQLTGRDNYRRAGQALGLPLEQRPELVERPEVAAKVAVWFWKSRVQPKVANFNDTAQVTRPINPGMRGLKDRHTKFQAIKQGALATPKQLAPRGQKI